MIDYEKIGFMAGIECHQQLNTRKLFSKSESKLLDEMENKLNSDLTKRKLRLVASESGEYDDSAKEEFKKGKEYIYESYRGYTTLVELDEEPPCEISMDALNTAIEIGKIVKTSFFDRAFIMRKMVIDGSNTSGFQRTAMISKDGYLEINNKKIGISAICIEEDSARRLDGDENYTKYSLDRLGIPLIEFTTKPDLKTPKDVQDCAAKIGELMRITGRAKRGLGSIRQDINISIREGARTEIKGVQYLDMIHTYVEYEVKRQLNLIDLKKKLNNMMEEKEIEYNECDISKEILNSNNKKLIQSIQNGQKAIAMKVKNFNGILGLECSHQKRVGTEIAGYVKVRAKVNGIFHSDELPKYDILEENVQNIKKMLNMNEKDAFIIVIEEESIAKKALHVAYERIKQLFLGVLEETRSPNEDGTTNYARPLPGSARMYPETDIVNIKITKDMLNKIETPIWYEDRINLYMKNGLNKQIATQIAENNNAKYFEKMIGKYDILSLSDYVLNINPNMDPNEYTYILDLEKENTIQRKDFKNIFYDLSLGENKNGILRKYKIEEISSSMIKVIEQVIEERKDFIIQKQENSLNPIMGMILKEIAKSHSKKPDMNKLSKIIQEKIEDIYA